MTSSSNTNSTNQAADLTNASAAMRIAINNSDSKNSFSTTAQLMMAFQMKQVLGQFDNPPLEIIKTYAILTSNTTASQNALAESSKRAQRINDIRLDVDAKVGQLDKKRQANFTTEKTDIENKISMVTKKRDALETQLKQLIQNQEKAIPELLKDLREGKTTKEAVLNQLNEFNRKIQEFAPDRSKPQDVSKTPFDILSNDEKKLLQQITALNARSSTAVIADQAESAMRLSGGG